MTAFASEPQVQAQGDRGHQVGERVVDGVGVGEAVVPLQVGLVEAPESGGLGSALGVGLDDADAGQVLLDEVAQAAEEILDGAEAVVHQGGHAQDDDPEEGQGQQHQQRQLPVDEAHENDAEDEHQGHLGEAAQAVHEEDADGVEIVGRPRHQVAGAVALVVGQGQGQQVGEVGGADVVLDADGGPAQEAAHAVVGRGHHHGEAEDPGDVEVDAAEDLFPGAGVQVYGVHRLAHEQRDPGGGRLSRGDGRQSCDDAFFVGEDVLRKRSEDHSKYKGWENIKVGMFRWSGFFLNPLVRPGRPAILRWWRSTRPQGRLISRASRSREYSGRPRPESPVR